MSFKLHLIQWNNIFFLQITCCIFAITIQRGHILYFVCSFIDSGEISILLPSSALENYSLLKFIITDEPTQEKLPPTLV